MSCLMFVERVFAFVVLVLTFTQGHAALVAAQSLAESDRLVLQDFVESTGFLGWNFDVDLCGQFGVFCQIIELELRVTEL